MWCREEEDGDHNAVASTNVISFVDDAIQIHCLSPDIIFNRMNNNPGLAGHTIGIKTIASRRHPPAHNYLLAISSQLPATIGSKHAESLAVLLLARVCRTDAGAAPPRAERQLLAKASPSLQVFRL